MVDHTNHRSAAGPRRGAVLLAAAAVTAPLALAGAVSSSASTVPAPPTDLADTTPGTTHGTTHGTGGIDGAALHQRLLHDEPVEPSPTPRDSAVPLHVQEKDPGGAAEGPGERAQRLPAPEARHGWELQVGGRLDTERVTPVPVAPSREDDGAIPLARDLGIDPRGDRRGITTTGTIGDGSHGSDGTATGDYDFYRVDARKGDTLTVDVVPGGELTPNALLYDARGHLVVGAQDMTGAGRAHLSHPVERGGTYYVAVGHHFPDDPFDPASGPGALTEGPYELDVSVHDRRQADSDRYLVPLRKGDVLGATVSGAARRVAVHELDGDLVQASATDPGILYPDGSPLPRGGNATASHVVDRTGLYVVSVADGAGDYDLTIGAHRAPSTRGEPPQTVLLDFSGPSFDNRIFGASALEPGVRDLSPMRDFLPGWGLDGSDERAVVEATTERVREILRDEIPGSRVEVTNNLADPGLFGEPGVSRVLVGGTVAEAGIIPALGLSESIDPGNFDHEETAIVMPELMTGDGPLSLAPLLTADSDRVRAVGDSLGHVAAHEIGHFVGNLHTDDHDDPTSVMNTGNLLHFYAVGPDGVAGTSDDDRIGMRTSRYDPLQGVSGIEDTTTRTAFALR